MHKSHRFDIKIQKFSGEGAKPPPQTLPLVGRGYPLPTPLGALSLNPFIENFWLRH